MLWIHGLEVNYRSWYFWIKRCLFVISYNQILLMLWLPVGFYTICYCTSGILCFHCGCTLYCYVLVLPATVLKVFTEIYPHPLDCSHHLLIPHCCHCHIFAFIVGSSCSIYSCNIYEKELLLSFYWSEYYWIHICRCITLASVNMSDKAAIIHHHHFHICSNQ